MGKQKQLTALAAQKQLLLAEAELHRQIISLECGALRTSLGWVDTTWRTARAMRPVGNMLALATGLFLAWRGRFFSKWGLRGLALWRLGRRFVKSKPSP